VRYSILSEATFFYCEKTDKKEFRVLMKHCFLAKKILLKPRLGLINIIWTLHQRNQPLRSGLLNLNETEFSQWTPERGCYRRKLQKGHKIILIEIAETLKISKKCIEHIVHEYLDMQKLFAK
jgi:hypothetical protein